MSADDDIRNGELEEMLAGEDETALGTAPGERDLGPDEPGGSEPPPEPPTPEFLADAGTADIGMPDELAADELVGDDMDAAEWAALDTTIPVDDAAPVAVPAAAPLTQDASAGDGWDDAEWDEFEARLERLEAIQHQVVLAARAHEAARVKRKVVASTTGAGAAGFIPLLLQLVDALSLSPQVAATVTDRGRRARRARRRLPHARSPARAPGRAGVGRRLAARRGAHRAAAGAAALAAAPGAPWARRAAPAVRSRLTAGRAPQGSAHADVQQPQGLRLVLRRRREAPGGSQSGTRGAGLPADGWGRGRVRARPARRRAGRRRPARASSSNALDSRRSTRWARPAKASTGSRKSMRSVR